MRIAVFGLGYVGCVSATCLAEMGHDVVGVDSNASKVALIRDGCPPITEPGLDALLKQVVGAGRLVATTSAGEALERADVSLLCVGTPSRPNGNLTTDYLDRVIDEVGRGLAGRTAPHVVAVRSTLLPGVFQGRLVPRLEAASGRRIGDGLGACVNPEFLRESTAIADFKTPPFTVIGELDRRSGDALAAIYEPIGAPVYRLSPDGASMVKYASNAFHALKVAFANEIGALCRELDIDARRVMEVFCRDTHLNVSPAYLRPGFAFGGSCLPKDLRAMLYASRHLDVPVPVLAAILPSNDLLIERFVETVASYGRRRVALLGLSFKPGTDDLRESPMVRVAEQLIGKGFRLAIYDEEVALSNLFGRNREYIEQMLPHIQQLLDTDLDAVIAGADIVVVGKKFGDEAALDARLRPDQVVLDLANSASWRPLAERSAA
jgi:GDP-mannose 6-dehydrogenase